MFERRLYFHIDWILIVAVFALCAIGLVTIYSATGGPTGIYRTQIYAIGLGIAAMLACMGVIGTGPASGDRPRPGCPFAFR